MSLRIEKTIVDVQVHDLERAVRFYQQTVGLPLLTKQDTWASFESKGAEIHLYLHGGTTHGVELRVRDIEREAAILKQSGVDVFANEEEPGLERILGSGIMEFAWGKMVRFKDSEGNQLALIQDS